MPQPQEQAAKGNEILIALGSNATSQVGDAGETVAAALEELRRRFPAGFAASRLFETPCFPPGAGPDFVNAACRAETDRTPEDVLALLHGIEVTFGRERRVRWGQRTLDLDLIAMGRMVLPDRATQESWRMLPAEKQRAQAPDRLVLPHPRLQDRSFVLVPLADIAATWTHPCTGQDVTAMLAALPARDTALVKPL